jgi:uncharacterized membrane protein
MAMHRINEVFTRHQWLQFVCAWVLATGTVLLIFPGSSPLATLLRAVLYSAVTVWFAVRRRRQEKAVAGGSADDLATLNHMLRAGKVPSDPARRDAMRTLVDQRLQRVRHRKAALVFLGGLLAVTAAGMFFTVTLTRALAYCAVCGACFAYIFVAGGVALHRLRWMRESLESTAHGADHAEAERHPTRSARHAA